MKKHNVFVVCSIVALIVSSSCSKETIQPKQEKILAFSSIEDYSETLTKVMSMTEQERLAWEQEQGFISFVTASTEVYERIAEKELSIEQLKEEILPLSEYLVLEQEESGDYILLHALESTPKRFIANKNRLLQIGNTLYKVFEHNVVMADVQYRLTLESLTEETYRNAISNEIQLMICEDELKDDTYNIPFNGEFQIIGGRRHIVERRNTNSSERIRVRVYFDKMPVRLAGHTVAWDISVSFDAGAYNRVLGIWYVAQRTISYDINIIYDYRKNYNSPWERKGVYRASHSGIRSRGESRTFITFRHEGPWRPMEDQLHFAALNCWAKQPNTNRANIIHNTVLF